MSHFIIIYLLLYSIYLFSYYYLLTQTLSLKVEWTAWFISYFKLPKNNLHRMKASQTILCNYVNNFRSRRFGICLMNITYLFSFLILSSFNHLNIFLKINIKQKVIRRRQFPILLNFVQLVQLLQNSTPAYTLSIRHSYNSTYLFTHSSQNLFRKKSSAGN